MARVRDDPQETRPLKLLASFFPCILDCTSESVEKGLTGAVYKYEKEENETKVFLAF